MLKEQNDKIIQLSEDKFKEVVAALELPTVRKRNLINSNVKDAFGRSLSKDTYKMSPEELEAYGKQQLQKKIKTGSLPGDSKIPRLKGESDATYKSRVAKTMQDRKRIINIRQGKKTEKKEESESYMKVDRMGNPIGRR
jgi:vacuolar-type H+-ATPase subunit C/Vma6